MYDIVFISYNEPNAEQNWELLKSRFPSAKRVNGVKGIHEAHIKAAKKCFTKMFWVVDADAELVEDFCFNYDVDEHNLNTVHVWRSKNPVNNLEYGYGGVKLLPRKLTLNLDKTKPDMTTSVSTSFKAIPEIANITRFNTDAFSSWRSGFRECAKLASQTIDRHNQKETQERLNIWCNENLNVPYGIDTIRGALDGRKFGQENKDNMENLCKINDFDWLYDRFSKNTV